MLFLYKNEKISFSAKYTPIEYKYAIAGFNFIAIGR